VRERGETMRRNSGNFVSSYISLLAPVCYSLYHPNTFLERSRKGDTNKDKWMDQWMKFYFESSVFSYFSSDELLMHLSS
jgi:hypothetical protein